MSLALLAKIANSVGLVLGIIGTVMLWRYGLPAEVRRHGRSFLAVGGPNSEEVEKAKRYDRRARIAISLLAMSFVLQFFASLHAYYE